MCHKILLALIIYLIFLVLTVQVYLLLSLFVIGSQWQENTSEKLPMPSYFRFLSLLAMKIFEIEKVDVAIMEVGLGGKYDATNVIEQPVVCGIASLGYDHMEILGNTLHQIAGEKAGIFKRGVPAFTVPQPEEAMSMLEDKAAELDVHLQVAPPVNPDLLSGTHLGLEGQHQYINAGLAIALCFTWLQRTGHVEINNRIDRTTLPEQFIKGLSTAALQGRAQIIPDPVIESESPGNLVFYLDGAHSPESMDVCAKWFSFAIKEESKQHESLSYPVHKDSRSLDKPVQTNHQEISGKSCTPILLFNCMSVRNPQLLLPRLMTACTTHGVRFKKALFVPNTSVYYKVGTGAFHPCDAHADLKWQLTLQRIWENLMHGERDMHVKTGGESSEVTLDKGKSAQSLKNSCVFPSLPLAIDWLRESVRRNQSVRFQVLVTGSLHLVGDILKLMKK